MGLTAAAVHELGTPLSTISVIISELVNNNQEQDLKEDLNVIQSQLKRCSEILERLRSNNLDQKNNEFINRLDFIRLINEIISSYQNNNIKVIISNDSYFEDTMLQFQDQLKLYIQLQMLLIMLTNLLTRLLI